MHDAKDEVRFNGSPLRLPLAAVLPDHGLCATTSVEESGPVIKVLNGMYFSNVHDFETQVSFPPTTKMSNTADPSFREVKPRHGGPERSTASLFRLDDRTIVSKTTTILATKAPT